MNDVAAFLLGLVWFAIFSINAIITLPALVVLIALMVGADIRGDYEQGDKWRNRVDILFYPTFWLGDRGIRLVRKDDE